MDVAATASSAPVPPPVVGDDDCYTIAETVTRDADDHAAGLQHWHQDYEQLSSGSFTGVLDEVWFGNLQIFRERTNQVVHETGGAWDGSRTIGVPVAVDGDGMFCGAPFSRDTIITLGHGDPLDFRTPKVLDIVAVTADANELREFGEKVWHVDTEARIAGIGTLAAGGDSTQRLREFLLLLLASIKGTPKVLNFPQIRKGMEQEVYNNLISAVCDTASSACATIAPSRKAIVDRAREYIREHHEEPVTIADLCTALNVSRRTMQYSFQAVLDVNPVAYLRAVRLNGARRLLKASVGDPTVTVADIAARWGFWHMSHFASDYRLMFGELPSRTLRNAH